MIMALSFMVLPVGSQCCAHARGQAASVLPGTDACITCTSAHVMHFAAPLRPHVLGRRHAALPGPGGHADSLEAPQHNKQLQVSESLIHQITLTHARSRCPTRACGPLALCGAMW